MGAANRRGTYDERKSAAIARDEAIEIRKEIERIEAYEALTPEQRRRRHIVRMKLATILSLSSGFK